MSTPLTDSINALTAYANEVTGGSDTTLSDAVHTLASGYGQGGYAPNGYIRLLYLESSGVQGIDTGKYLKLNSKFVIDCCYVPGNYGYYTFIFGSANPLVYADTITGANEFTTSNGYWKFGNSSENSFSLIHHNRGILELTKNSGTYHNYDFQTITRSVTLNATSVEENPNSHLCLFCRGNEGLYEKFATCRIYEYWYYEDDILIQHMIPVKRKSDNVLGMYDLIENIFYTNIGTGEFIEGEW